MKLFYSILRRDNSILLFLLLYFLFIEYFENYKLFTWASPVLFAFLLKSRYNLLRHVPYRVCLIILIFATYWLFSINYFPLKEFIYHCFPVCFLYLLGQTLLRRNRDEQYIMGLLLFVPLCTGLYDILYSLGDIRRYGLINPEIYFGDQERTDAIRGTSLISAECCTLIACLVFFFFDSKDYHLRKMYKFGGYLATLAALCSMHFVSRTAFIVIVVTLLIGLITKFNKGIESTTRSIVVIIVLALLLLNSGIGDMYLLKNEESEILTGNGRLERMQMWIEATLDNPWGVAGIENERLRYAHNFWIDYAKVAGWIPGICLLLFSLLNIQDVIKIYKKSYLSNSIKLFVVSLLFAYILSYFVEPIMSGAKIGMFTYFFFCGIISFIADNPVLHDR